MIIRNQFKMIHFSNVIAQNYSLYKSAQNLLRTASHEIHVTLEPITAPAFEL